MATAVRLVDATVGRGCSYCEIGIPIDSVKGYRTIKLCLECVLRWFARWTVMNWEDNHAPFRDHLDDRLARAIENQIDTGQKVMM